MAINLLDDDINFIWSQVTLPGNNPLNGPAGTILSNTGIRDVQGVGNNVNNPLWGAADTLFPRLTYNAFDAGYAPTTGGFKLNFGTGQVSYDPALVTDYSTRNTTVQDASPRIISNLVSNQDGLTTLQVQDRPEDTPGGRLSPLTGNTNPLPYSTWMALFGQFFDHGLDFVHKGADGSVIVPLLPGDSLYSTAPGANNFMVASRTNTVNVTIGEGSTDALISRLGITESTAWSAVTGTTVLNNNNYTGTIVLNNHIINLGNGVNRQGLVDAINVETGNTGVVASLTVDNHLVLTPDVKESFNTISPFIDLSQSYGSVASHTVFLREYDANGFITGNLVSGSGGAHTLATWADIKANALKIGLTLHDYNVTDVPLVYTNADGTPFIGNNPATPNVGPAHAWFIALDKTTGATVYVSDTNKVTLSGQNLVLATAGHAFLDDMAHGVLSEANLNAVGDLSGVNKTNLESHFIAGDGRANENIGLTSIHDIFHSEHATVLEEIIAQAGLTNNGDGTWTQTLGAGVGNVWTGEYLFQAAKLVTEMEYQHGVFGEFARKLSPNINAFAAYDVTIDASITAEFAHAVYRFGHSMLTEEMALTDVNGSNAGSMTLIDAFLNPNAYVSGQTAGDIARGMSNQVGNAIDEWITPALRDNLVGLPLDLATLNMVRARDAGVPTLNEVRANLFQQTGLTTLKPYDSWDDLSLHLLHPEALVNFVMAYARDAVLLQFGVGATGATDAEKLAFWNNLQLTNPTAYGAALQAAADLALNNTAFMTGGNTDFNKIDLWLGGLAEAKVTGGMLGSTMDFVFATQMINLQNGDRFYYLDRLVGTNLLAQIEGQLFSDIVARNTGATHLYTDIFSVADDHLEMNDFATGVGSLATPFATLAAKSRATVPVQDAENVSRLVGQAGYVGTTFYGNDGNYLDARGVFNPNGKGSASEIIGGTAAADIINGLGGNDAIYGDGGNDTIEGGLGNDFLHGGDDDDLITDSEGDDLIWGDAGNDVINAGVGIDQVFGGDGNDIVYGGLGADIVDGGAGADVVYGDNGAGAVLTSVTDAARRAELLGLPTALANTDMSYFTLAGVMDPTGDADVITGGDGNDVIFGGGGADAIDGGDGDDLIYGGAGPDALVGWYGNDRFIMDRSSIGIGNTIDGGEGFDLVDYSASLQAVTVDLSNAGALIIPPAGVLVADTFLSVEGLIGSAFADTLTGGAAFVTDAAGAQVLVNGLPVPVDFYINGGAGNDAITGGDGNDTLVGGADNDALVGGLGNDSYYVDANGDTVTELAGEGTDKVYSSVTYTLGANLEQLQLLGSANINGSGNNLANTITGNIGNNTLNGGTGADTLIGLAGNDTYVVDNVGDVVTEAQDEGTDLVQASVTYTLGANLENLTLTGNGNINGTGNELANVITGNGGVNTLLGLAGNDTIVGGNGNDFINGGLGADSLAGGGGNDRFVYTAVADSAPGTADRITDFVRGADLIDLTGMGFTWIGTNQFSAANQLRYSTANGVTTIEGNTVGANGAEFSIQLTGNIALTVSDFVGVAAAANTINGTNGNNTLNGTAAANIINGLNGNDTLNGLAGNDSLNGGAGNDSLSGGAGADVLSGGRGNDIFLFAAGDSTTALRDTIVDFEIAGTVERINVSAIDANTGTNGNGTFAWRGTQAITGAGQLNATQSGADTIIRGNTDGNAATFEFELLLVGVTASQLTAADFVL